MANKTKAVMTSLIVVIVILAAILIYALVIKPAVGSYVYNQQLSAYNQAQGDFLNAMLVQLQQQGYISIPVGNQTLYLAQAQPQQQGTTPAEPAQ